MTKYLFFCLILLMSCQKETPKSPPSDRGDSPITIVKNPTWSLELYLGEEEERLEDFPLHSSPTRLNLPNFSWNCVAHTQVQDEHLGAILICQGEQAFFTFPALCLDPHYSVHTMILGNPRDENLYLVRLICEES